MRRVTKKLLLLLLGVLLTTFYCEYLIYYIVIAQCSWPVIKSSVNNSPLKAFILADIHLLGPRKGRWLDKWRREWQMHQAYQAIVTLHKPDVIFILGDLFDEGELSNENQFEAYVDRFHELFQVSTNSALFVVVGNHDIGYHNYMKKDSSQRFMKMLNSSSVQFISLKQNNIVLINSMAMEGDRCNMCTEARNDISKIAGMLECTEDTALCYDDIMKVNHSRPVLMQHFPLYRVSDGECNGPDVPSPIRKTKPYRMKFDTLSFEATNFLVTKIKPRLVIGGHTHHGCIKHHKYTDPEELEFYEYSVPSFSWRNRPNPKYMLVTMTPSDYSIATCGLPLETTMAITAIIMLFIVIYQVIKIRSFGR